MIDLKAYNLGLLYLVEMLAAQAVPMDEIAKRTELSYEEIEYILYGGEEE